MHSFFWIILLAGYIVTYYLLVFLQMLSFHWIQVGEASEMGE